MEIDLKTISTSQNITGIQYIPCEKPSTLYLWKSNSPTPDSVSLKSM